MAQAYFVQDGDRVELKVTILHGITAMTEIQLGEKDLGMRGNSFELPLGTGAELHGRILRVTTKVADAPGGQGVNNLTGVKYELSRNQQPADYINEQSETVLIDRNTTSFTQTVFFTRHAGG